MEFSKEETLLIIKDNKLEMKNRKKTNDNEELTCVCKLDDFFSNNIDFELNKISILQLENCDLNEIPSNIQKFNLKQLILARNKLREVPSCLYSSLSGLELLDLSHNFIESFDIEPACRCAIVTLKLNDNKMRNFPNWVLNLRAPKLTEVVYSNNNLTDITPSHPLSIKKLEMRNCNLMDVDYQFFKSLKHIESLDISNNNSTHMNENNFNHIDRLFVKTHWHCLKVLNLSNLVVSILPEGLFWIKPLTELYLSNCDLSWIPSNIRFLVNLQILDVSDNSICSLPEDLSHLKKLQVIKAPFNAISSVANFTHHIQVLDLYHNYLEEFPAFVNDVEFLDLEKNCFDAKNHDSYEEKRDQLRQMFCYQRVNGPRALPEEYDSGDSYRTVHYSESDDSDSVQYQNNYCDSDNWDEEEPQPVINQKNTQVTSSDDEWDGVEDIRRMKKVVRQPVYEVYEDWIFSDAEEE